MPRQMPSPPPIIVLVETQLGENIGMCARAMLNCGFEQLRLVRPRDGWPSEAARATAADADIVLEQAQVFDDIDSALTDCQRVYAATARQRSLNVPGLDLSDAIVDIETASPQSTTAVLFGPEASGLDNKTLSRADRLIHFPTNPAFPSLNLAQAVLLFSWQWWQSTEPSSPAADARRAPTTREELDLFLRRMEEALDQRNFFLTPDMKPDTVRTLRTIFTRAQTTPEELRMLHGVLTALQKSPVL